MSIIDYYWWFIAINSETFISTYLYYILPNEASICSVSNCSCTQCLASSRWTIKQHTFWWLNAKVDKSLRMKQGRLNDFSQLLNLFLAASNITVGTSGFSSTCIIVTVGSIFGGRGIWIWYLFLSTPTLMPSSISVGATESARSTTNLSNCLTFIIYLNIYFIIFC